MIDAGVRQRGRQAIAGRLRASVVLLAFLTATITAAMSTAVMSTAAAAEAGSSARVTAPRSPDPATGRITAPGGEYATRLAFDVSAIDPTLVTSTGPSALTITGTMTNTGPDELVDLTYRVQRGDALRSTADVHDQIAAPDEPVARVPNSFTPITGALAAGASAPFVFSASIDGPDALDITRPGVYPVMVNVNGAVMLPDGPLAARVGELHLMLTVMGVPGATAPEQTAGRPTPFNFVWPMVDVPHLGVEGVFLNDDLLASISPGGRLSTLLDGLTGDATSTLPTGALTIVLDPQMLDELNRMTGAYRVVAPPGTAQPPVSAITQAQAADQTTSPPATDATESVPVTPGGTAAATPAPTDQTAGSGAADIAGTVAGTGQQVAASFVERLRAVAASHPLVLLPYGDPDVVALVRAGMAADVTTTTQHGQEVAERMWGDLDSVTSASASPTAFPIDGAADEATLSTLLSGGARTGLLSQAAVQVPTAADGRPVTSALIAPDQGGAGLPSVVAQTDVLGGLDKLIDDDRQTGWATKVNSLTALLAQQRADGTTAPSVFAPTRRWSPDSAALTELIHLLGELGRNGVIAGESLATLSAAAQQEGTTDYPEAARDRELSAAYLQRIVTDRAAVADLRTTLNSVSQQSDPATLLDPLDAALDAAASTAFRTDSTVGEANLSTVESTVSTIRSGVQIATASTSYTLASSTSPLVLTVQNSTPYDVPALVQLTGGEMVGLTTTEQPVQIIPAGRSQQVKIPTEVTRSGQFQVTATLVGPDGVGWGSPVQLSVQSSAYGALTVVLMAVAGGVLVIMVALRIRQRLRGRRARLAAAATTAATTAESPAEGAAGPTPAPSPEPRDEAVLSERREHRQ
ncbi:MAG TPA: DUF6049 family protein [Nakamurella sp.]